MVSIANFNTPSTSQINPFNSNYIQHHRQLDYNSPSLSNHIYNPNDLTSEISTCQVIPNQFYFSSSTSSWTNESNQYKQQYNNSLNNNNYSLNNSLNEVIASNPNSKWNDPYDSGEKKKNLLKNQSASKKTRTKDKYRVVYNEIQRYELEREFVFSKYITSRRKTELASILDLSQRQIKIWFQNRRAKDRKLNKKKRNEISNSFNESSNKNALFLSNNTDLINKSNDITHSMMDWQIQNNSTQQHQNSLITTSRNQNYNQYRLPETFY